MDPSAIKTLIDLNGTWASGGSPGPVISVTSTSLTVDMSAYHRPAAHGSIADGSTITVTFPDDATYTAKLQAPGTIQWSNGSAWTKVGASSQESGQPGTPTVDIPDLMEHVYNYFLDKFHQTSDIAPETTFLAFQQVGTPLPQEMFTVPADSTVKPEDIAVQAISTLANIVPALDANQYTPTGKTVDAFYEMLLNGSQFDPQGGDNTLFASQKREALETFNNVSLPTLYQGVAMRFHPAYATPSSWYDALLAANWYTFSSDTATQPGPVGPVMARMPGTPPPGTPPAASPVQPDFAAHPWTWRVVAPNSQSPTANPGFMARAVPVPSGDDTACAAPAQAPPSYAAMLQAMVALPAAPADAPAIGSPAGPTVAAASRIASSAPVVRDHRGEPPAVPAEGTGQIMSLSEGAVVRDHRDGSTGSDHRGEGAAPPPAADPVDKWVATFVDLDHTLNANPGQPPGSHSLVLSFQYCLVKLDRPWLSQPFLFTRDWYMPGFNAGEFSNPAATDKGGIFPALPIACLVVKDLKITADAAEISSVAGQAGAFGPFLLTGQTIDQTETALTAEGMQAVAWLCQMLPVLPPLGSPLVLNAPLGLASKPGVAEPVFTVLPQGTSVMPTAEEVTIGDTVLIKIKAGNQTGWVNKAFLA